MMRATDLAFRLDLRRYPHSWRGRCPCCDYSGNTFSVRAAKDGRARLYCANGCDQNELAQAVAQATGQSSPAPATDPDNVEVRGRKRHRALALWRGSERAVGTLAERYLTARGLPGLAASSALRFRGDTLHPEYARLPALVALVSDVTGSPVAIHRTYLAHDSAKARVEPDKASLGSVWGGAIRLDSLMPHVALVVGEGIESSASAGRLMGLPAWAAIKRREPGQGPAAS